MNKSDSIDAHSGRAFVITRVFDAPRELVFKAWTEAERLAQWWGPKDFTMLSCDLELRPGGALHYRMRAPNGAEMWGRWVFREIVKPERLVFVVSFSNSEGAITRAPFNPDWPLEVLSTVTFTEREGRTTITMRGAPINATESERETFVSNHELMRKGWTGTMDQLADYLAKA